MIGWLNNVAEAETYFSTRFGSEPWDSLQESTGNMEKTAALTTSYNRINYSTEYSIPTSPTSAQLAKLKDAQCEMALYMAIHLKDEDRRKGIQAQGVVGAGIVKETYSRFKSDKVSVDSIPIPPIVREMLRDFYKYGKHFYAIDIDRDEDEKVSKDVTES